MTDLQLAALIQQYRDLPPTERKKARLRGLEALRSNPAWFDLFEPYIAGKAKLAADMHEKESLPAHARAEWLFAMKLFRELSELFEKEIKRHRQTRILTENQQ